MKINSSIFVSLLLLVFISACSSEESIPEISAATERTIVQGVLRGIEGKHNSHAWLGIPFAKPPVGSLRWKSPLDPEVFDGVLNANQHGARCIQFAGGFNGGPGEAGTLNGSEDCLYLSVYAPKFAKDKIPQGDEQLPVMVWIHGGSNKAGTGSTYDGSRLSAEQNVIVVSINYRLGPFGWFFHPALNKDGDSLDKSGNYGTLDSVQALKWVQNNIAAFGGDVNNVTLFGESAGAFDTLSLMLSPVAEGLFHKAISQSGGLTLTPLAEAANFVEDNGDEFSSQQVELYMHIAESAERVDVDPIELKQAIVASSESERAEFLLARSADQIMNAYRYGGGSPWARNPGLLADGFVLPFGDPVALFADKNSHNNVPLLLGTNKEEMKLYQFSNPDLIDTYLGFYFVVKDQDKYDAYADYSTRMWKYNGVDTIAEALSRSMPGKVWAYRFDWNEQAQPFGIEIDQLLGAAHAMEIPFVFGFTDLGDVWRQMYDEDNLPNREILSARMRNYWAAFAYSNDPSTGLDDQGIQWRPWNNSPTSSDKFLVLDSALDGGIRMSHKVVTLGGIEQDIREDKRLSEVEEKCKIFAGLALHNERHWPKSDYPNKLSGACAAFPLIE